MSRLALSLTAFAAILVAAAAWFFLAPPQLGGRTSYAVVYGTSMEPHLRRGDLVVLRQRASYRPGEVVAYRSSQLHREVLHRIVSVRGDRFTFKGDNNGFLDPEQPGAAQLFGAEWVRVPGMGSLVQRLRSPRVAALAAALLALFLVGGSGTTVRRRRRRSGPETAPEPAGSGSGSAAAPSLVLAGAFILAISLAVGLVAFTRPAERTLVSPDLYVKRGTFSYSARVSPGAVYQSDMLDAPAPVYLKLVDRLDVGFAYSTSASAPASLAGTSRLDAVLRDATGWSRELALQPERSFTGGRATLHGSLDLAGLSALIGRFEAQTGEHNSPYALELRPRISLRGTVAGRPVRDVFAPTLTFDLDALHLRLRAAAGATAGDPLVRIASAAGTRRAASPFGPAGLRTTVGHARRLVEVGLAAGLLSLLAGGLLLLRGRRDDEVTVIERRYADWIVEVGPGERTAEAERRVSSMKALARLAERYDRLILHERRHGGDSYLVEDDGIVYRYDVERAATPEDEAVTLFGWGPADRVRPLAEDRP